MLDFLTKEKLTTGFGNEIINPTSYEDILHQAALDWTVETHPAYTNINGRMVAIPKTNVVVRVEDEKPLGIVSDKYKIVNNDIAFSFTEQLFKDGSVEFIRGDSYKGGRATWLEAKITSDYSILGDKVECYLIFKNSHDGTGSVIAMILPTRIECSNALNIPLAKVPRHWRCVHSGNPLEKIEEAKKVLLSGTAYMNALNDEAERLQTIKIDRDKVVQYIERLYPIGQDMTERTKNTRIEHREKMLEVYDYKADLQNFGNSAYRFIGAVADYIDHADGKRNTDTAVANRFMKVAYGHDILDMAYKMVA